MQIYPFTTPQKASCHQLAMSSPGHYVFPLPVVERVPGEIAALVLDRGDDVDKVVALAIASVHGNCIRFPPNCEGLFAIEI